MLRYKFRFNSFLSEALYIGLFYEYWIKIFFIINVIICYYDLPLMKEKCAGKKESFSSGLNYIRPKQIRQDLNCSTDLKMD